MTHRISTQSFRFGKQRVFLPFMGCVIQWLQFFYNFSKSMKNQGLSFHLIAIVGSLENLYGPDLVNGAPKNKNLISQNLDLVTNISKSMRDQRLKFGIISVLDLLIMINGFDLDCGTRKLGFQIKQGYPCVTCFELQLRLLWYR